MPKRIVATLAAGLALGTAAPASADNVAQGVRATGAFISVVGTSPSSFTVAFECTASAYADAASTAVNDCSIMSDSTVYAVTDAGNCALGLPGPLAATPCTGSFRINAGRIGDAPADLLSRRGLKVCYSVSATYITDPNNPESNSGCSMATLIPAGGGTDISDVLSPIEIG